jgi:hypothetical protein
MSTAEDFVKDLDAAKKEVASLQQSNSAKVQALAQYGKGVDPAMLANLKIDTFIESFLDEAAQLVYVRNLEVRMRQMLDEALASVRQEQLTQGVGAPKGLIVPR